MESGRWKGRESSRQIILGAGKVGTQVVLLEVESQTPETWCGFIVTITLSATTLQMLRPTIHPKSTAVGK